MILDVACSQVAPAVFLLDGVAPLHAPQKMTTSWSSRVTRARAARFLKRNSARKKISAITSVSKRRHSSGNRISWTSGQWTEVHKIMVTTCAIFVYVRSRRRKAIVGVARSQVGPAGFLWVSLAPFMHP